MTPTEQLLRDAHDLLDCALGDSELDHFESEEEEREYAPVQVAARLVRQAIDALAATSQQAEGDDGFESVRRFLLGGLYEISPAPAQQEVANPLLKIRYTTIEPYLHRWKLILGFDTLEELSEANRYITYLSSPAQSREPTSWDNAGGREYD